VTDASERATVAPLIRSVVSQYRRSSYRRERTSVKSYNRPYEEAPPSDAEYVFGVTVRVVLRPASLDDLARLEIKRVITIGHGERSSSDETTTSPSLIAVTAHSQY